MSASRTDSSRGELAMTPSSSRTFQGKLCLGNVHFLFLRKPLAPRAPQSAREGYPMGTENRFTAGAIAMALGFLIFTAWKRSGWESHTVQPASCPVCQAGRVVSGL